MVSTHSRAEAAAKASNKASLQIRFQHTAARRRLQKRLKTKADPILVSTHSRAEAAAIFFISEIDNISFNTQPRGGGCPYFY